MGKQNEEEDSKINVVHYFNSDLKPTKLNSNPKTM